MPSSEGIVHLCLSSSCYHHCCLMDNRKGHEAGLTALCMGGSELLVFCRPGVINQAVTGSPWAAITCPLCTNVFLSRPVELMAWWRMFSCYIDVTGKSTEDMCVCPEHVQTWCNQLPRDSQILILIKYILMENERPDNLILEQQRQEAGMLPFVTN